MSTAGALSTAIVGAGPAGLLFAAVGKLLHTRAGDAVGPWALRLYDKRESYVRTHRLRIAPEPYEAIAAARCLAADPTDTNRARARGVLNPERWCWLEGADLERVNRVRSSIPAVTPIDVSARVQTVHRDTSPRFHALLTAFHARTGRPVLVNTSFNVRGEPIVGYPFTGRSAFDRADGHSAGIDGGSSQLVSLAKRLARMERELAELRAAVASRDATIAKQEARIAELERELGKNSRNSSKPPSTDSPEDKEERPARKPSERKPGGQQGHKGTQRTLLPPDRVTRTRRHFPCRCGNPDCRAELPKTPAGEPLREQTIEVPKIVPDVTENHPGTDPRQPACAHRHGRARPQLPSADVRRARLPPSAHRGGAMLLTRQIAVLPSFVGLLLLSTCCDSAPVGEDTGIDGGRDAASPPRDAARADAPRDVGHDIGIDVRFEGDPEFVPLPLPGVTDERDVVLRARYPERYPMVGWYPCVGSVPSCRQIERNANHARPVEVFRTNMGLWAATISVSARGDTYDGIGPIEGPLAGIWRRPRRDIADGGPSFGAAWHTASENTAAFAVTHRHDGVFDERVYVAPLAEIGAAESPRYVVDMRVDGRGFQRMWVTDTAVLGEVQPDLSLYLWRLDHETFQVADDRDAVPGLPQSEFLVGDRVFYEAWNDLDETRLAMTGWDLPTRTIVDIDPADVKGFATDGRDMAWLQLYDRDLAGNYGRIELWTMPYSDDPDPPASATLVDSTFPLRAGDPLVGGGWYVYVGTDTTQVVLRPLGIGPSRYFRTPDGTNVTGHLYVDATNLFVRSGPDLFWVDPRELPEL